MRCRACQKEIPDESALCFHCGAVQERYISPRITLPKKKKPAARGTLITAVSLLLIVVVILVAGPLIKDAQKLPRFEEIKTDIATLDPDDELAVTAVKSKIDNYNRDYPDTDELLEVKQLMDEKMGWITEPPDVSPPRVSGEDEDAARQALKDTLFDQILSAKRLVWARSSVSGHIDVTLYWRNKSDQNYKDIYFTVEARDKDGNVIPGLKNPDEDRVVLHPKGAPFAPTGDGDPYLSRWYDVWPDGEVETLHLVQVGIYDQYNRRLTLDEELAALIWEPEEPHGEE